MADILYYLLKVSIGTAVFYSTYHFLFRKSKHYVFNRLYLIGSFVVSFIIPMITFKAERYVTATSSSLTAEVTAFSESSAFASESGSSLSLYNYLLIIYLLGVVFFISKLIYSCIVAARIKRSSQMEQIKGLSIYVTEDNIRAFTFLDKIIIGKNILGHPSLIMILVHESVHSKEKHFYDILTAELLFSLQWFNPFAWLHRDAIRNNLEFRADDMVIRESDAEEYQLTMLSMVQNRVKPPLFTELNSSNVKKRIIMMKRENITRFSGIARFAVIPVFAILLLSLSVKETIIIQDHTRAIPGDSQPETFAIVENSPGELESVNDLRRYIAAHIRYPKDAAESGQTGTVELFARVSGNGMIDEVMEIQPEEDYVNIDEIVIVGYKPENVEAAESSTHEVLISESRRVIDSFPKLEIPELYGKTIKLQFIFVLQ
jgi:beta-lactamase regulating signal transducer with metallopeptidase domain